MINLYFSYTINFCENEVDRLKIALVDDEQECLDEMAQLCSDFGIQHHCQMETVSFTSGEAFLNAFEKGGFSVVFMDIYVWYGWRCHSTENAEFGQQVYPCISDFHCGIYAGRLFLPCF